MTAILHHSVVNLMFLKTEIYGQKLGLIGRHEKSDINMLRTHKKISI